MSNIKLPKVGILFEDKNVLAVNKPVGLMVHPDGRDPGPFLTDWIMKEYPELEGVGDPARDLEGQDIKRPGIVHRLDRETSGVLLIAKTMKGFESLKKQFQDRTISKKYLTFVWGELDEEFGTINRPIGRSGSDFRKWSAQRGTRGETREAVTYWTRILNGRVIVPEISSDKPEKFSLVEVQPKTGRTHQIRVHFNAVNHPVIGDTLYAPKRPMALGFKRLALHSWKIEFEDLNGKRHEIEAPLPSDFKKAKKELESKSFM